MPIRSGGRPPTPDDFPEHPVTTDGTYGAGQETQEFAAFVAQHGRGLDRLAYLMLGDEHAGEDLAAEALLAAWQHWDRVRRADYPLAYVRRILVNQASGHFRRRAREQRGLEQLKLITTHTTQNPDGAAVVDVRSALLRLPPRRRACLVLRYAFELTEDEVAESLGISVGTVKSQTSKAVTQFRREIGDAVPAVPGTREPEALASTRWRKKNHAG
jgi:RNA polymerase sigma-70 factor (sigma-E family)